MKQVLAGYEQLKLPVLPSTLALLQAQLADSNASNHALQETLMRDPAAVIALYRQLCGQRSSACENITGPAHAISMMGREAFTQLARQLTPLTIQTQADELSPLRAYSLAAHAACYAQALCQTILGRPDDETEVAALLHCPASLALWDYDYEAAARAMHAVAAGVSQEIAWRGELGEPLISANQRLGSAWSLPGFTLDALDETKTRYRRQTIAEVAHALAAAAQSWSAEAIEQPLEALAELLGIDASAASAWWHEQTALAAQRLNGAGYPLAAYELLRLPGDEPPVELPAFLDRPAKSKASTGTDLQTLVGETLRSMRSEIGLQRAVFAVLNRERSLLRARMSIGTGRSPLGRFNLAMRERHLFSLLLGKQQSIWVSPGNRAKYQVYLKAIPQDAQSLQGFYAMSLFVRNKPLGLVYADGGELNELGYKRFRQLCQHIAHQLDEQQPAVA